MSNNRLNIKTVKNSKLPLALFLVIFAGLGVYLLTGSHAATPYASITADKGTLTSPATSQACAGASDGNCVKFGGVATTNGVNPAPTGPAAPSGGWHVALADGFGTPLGTGAGQDNFWYPNENSSNPCSDYKGNNSNELEVYNCSQVQVTSQGLQLIDKYLSTANSSGKYYVSGAVQDFPRYASQGYQSFTYQLGRGATFVFELDAQLPVNTGEADPGWWSISTTRWPPEIDFFEEWGWGTCYNSSSSNPNANCITGVTYINPDQSLVQGYKSLYTINPPGDPSAGFHRYTTVVGPSGIQEYIDGVQQSWANLNPTQQTDTMSLILTNALRSNTSNISPNFTSGTRTFAIRSVAVYEDSAHAGQFVSGGGVAPGTTVNP
jgi:hypothetical protein